MYIKRFFAIVIFAVSLSICCVAAMKLMPPAVNADTAAAEIVNGE